MLDIGFDGMEIDVNRFRKDSWTRRIIADGSLLLLFAGFLIYISAIAVLIFVNPLECSTLSCFFPKEALLPYVFLWLIVHSRVRGVYRYLSSALFFVIVISTSLMLYFVGAGGLLQSLTLSLPIMLVHFALAFSIWYYEYRNSKGR